MILLHLAVIITLSKFTTALGNRFKQPPVLGMLLLGLLLGPSGFGLIQADIVLKWLAKLGVIILLFMAGLQTDILQMRRVGRFSLITASGGVLLPFLFGFGLSLPFGYNLTKGLIIGAILTATSVSVTVMTLMDMKRLKSDEGTVILGAAVLDDVMAIILLTFILGLASSSPNFWLPLSKVVAFFLLAALLGFLLFGRIMRFAERLHASHGVVALALGIAFFYSWSAEYAGVAHITGAYIAGLLLGRTPMKRRILAGMETLGQSLFISIFFVEVGLEAELRGLNGGYLFIFLLIIAAILGKVAGAGLGGHLSGLGHKGALRVGVGMLPRGEVALVIASLGMSNHLIGQPELSGTVLMVVITAIMTPMLLKFTFRGYLDVSEFLRNSETSGDI